jgi:hypothetical protein
VKKRIDYNFLLKYSEPLIVSYLTHQGHLVQQIRAVATEISGTHFGTFPFLSLDIHFYCYSSVDLFNSKTTAVLFLCKG